MVLFGVSDHKLWFSQSFLLKFHCWLVISLVWFLIFSEHCKVCCICWWVHSIWLIVCCTIAYIQIMILYITIIVLFLWPLVIGNHPVCLVLIIPCRSWIWMLLFLHCVGGHGFCWFGCYCTNSTVLIRSYHMNIIWYYHSF